jgi:glucose/arabinose dehydrogenase
LSLFADGFNLPIGIVSAGDSYLYVVERRGKIKVVDSVGQVLPSAFLDLGNRVRSNAGEQGLLGLAFSPRYAQDGEFYLNYILNDGSTRISRFRRNSLNPLIADPNSEQALLTIAQPFSNHNGGDMHFGPDGYLYIALGDGGNAGDPGDRAQTVGTYLGKILRIDVDSQAGYSIPPDNPHINDPNVLDEIWSSGWRNPWRFSFDRETGDMWVGDVGQNRVEEISIEPDSSQGGLNFGWRCLEGNTPFNATGCGNISLFQQALHTYSHNGGNRSVTGGYVYRGKDYPTLEGHYFFGDYETGEFWSLIFDNGFIPSLHTYGELLGNQQLSSFGQDHRGEIYVAAYNAGKIYQLIDLSSSIQDGFPALPLRLTPNPSEGKIRFVLPERAIQAYELRILDLRGKTVAHWNELIGLEQELTLPGLATGLYWVELRGKRVYTAKLLVR